MKGTQIKLIILALFSASLFLAGMLIQSSYALHIMIMFFVYCTLAVSWNFVRGFGGQLSLMQQGFFGAGMYTTGLLAISGLSFFVTLPASLISGFLLGIAIAIVLRNVKGLVYGVGGIMIAEGMRIVVINVEAWGGSRGLTLPVPAGHSKLPYYYASLTLLVAALWLIYVVMRSKHSLAIVATRDDDEAAEVLGVNTLRYKIYLLAISAAFTACVGGVYGLYNTFIEPYSSFNLLWMMDVVIMVEFGGVGTFIGPIAGSVIFFVLTEFIRYQYGLFHLLFGGLFLIVIALFFKQGVVGSLIKRYKYLKFLDIE
jgi:branched-chain amino acid transport system permease protein